MPPQVDTFELALPDGHTLPVISIDTGIEGSCTVVTSNLHGDECTGIGVVHALAAQLPGVLTAGSVHMYPSLNPGGLARGIRGLPDDDQDPNRAFPGKANGCASERHAHRIWVDITARKPDRIVDIHTDSGNAIPYAIIDRLIERGRRRLEAECNRLAQASGLTVLREYPKDRYVRYRLDHSLPGALVNGPGVAAVTLEVGPRGRIDPDSVDLATRAVLGILTAGGQVEIPAVRHSSQRDGGPWRRESGPRTNHAGALVPVSRPGASLTRGTPISEVRTLTGEVLEVLCAKGSGFVVAFPDRTHVVPGVACATLAVVDD